MMAINRFPSLGFSRRGHTVLKTSLPAKEEHVLFVRMTKVTKFKFESFRKNLYLKFCKTVKLLTDGITLDTSFEQKIIFSW